MVEGFEDFISGEIATGGSVVTERDQGDHNVALVFHDYALHPHVTEAGTTAFSLRDRGVAKRKIRRVEKAAATLEFAHLPARRPCDLGGGQRQRAAMSRTRVRYPKGFVLDGPLSNLDPDLRVHMWTEIERLRERVRTITIDVTPDQVGGGDPRGSDRRHAGQPNP